VFSIGGQFAEGKVLIEEISLTHAPGFPDALVHEYRARRVVYRESLPVDK